VTRLRSKIRRDDSTSFAILPTSDGFLRVLAMHYNCCFIRFVCIASVVTFNL